MAIVWEWWFLFPSAIMISTIAMASGVGGAIFFSPLFIIVLGLDPKVAIGAALLTELFGFSSGLIAYKKSKLIDFKLGIAMLKFSIPAAVLGTLLGAYIPSDILKAIFATGIIYIGYQIFISWRAEEREKQEALNKREFAINYESELTDANKNVFRYTVCYKNQGRMFATIGGMFVGMISVGLGELMDFHLVSRCKVPTPVAVATAIFAVVVTVFVASIGHFYNFFFNSPPAVMNQALAVVMFTIPGVLIGGQIGPRLQRILSPDIIKAGLSILFIIVGCLMYFTLIK